MSKRNSCGKALAAKKAEPVSNPYLEKDGRPTEALRKVLSGDEMPASLLPLAQKVQSKLGDGPEARGLAFYEIGQMLIKTPTKKSRFFQDCRPDMLFEIRQSCKSDGLIALTRWDRTALAKELTTPRADGRLPSINYFAVVDCYLEPSSPELQSLLKEMRSENLPLSAFCRRIRATMKCKNRFIGTHLAPYQLDEESECPDPGDLDEALAQLEKIFADLEDHYFTCREALGECIEQVELRKKLEARKEVA
jgi:hypothetical protein